MSALGVPVEAGVSSMSGQLCLLAQPVETRRIGPWSVNAKGSRGVSPVKYITSKAAIYNLENDDLGLREVEFGINFKRKISQSWRGVCDEESPPDQ